MTSEGSPVPLRPRLLVADSSWVIWPQPDSMIALRNCGTNFGKSAMWVDPTQRGSQVSHLTRRWRKRDSNPRSLSGSTSVKPTPQMVQRR
jgi:hypothetical protein